jgi:gliding motility-associated-like protein
MRLFFTVLLAVFGLNLSAQVINTFPYYDDLETWNLCSEVCSVSCAISSDWSNVGNVDFRPDTAGTPTGSTGPSVDHNPGLSSGVYAYVESSSPCNPDTALLESPYVDLTNVQSPGFTFWYHQQTATSIPDTFDILISTDSGATWSTALTGPNNTSSTSWQFDTLGLGSYIGQVIKLRFQFITANAFNDFAVDDFTFHGIQIIDAGLDSLFSSNGFCLGDSSNLCINLINDGILPIDSVTIYSSLNGGALFSPFVFQDTLGPGEDTILCIGNVLLSTGDSIAFYTDMPNGLNDTFNLNDTLSLTVSMNTLPTLNAGVDTTICGFFSYPLGGSPTSTTATVYDWTLGTYLNDSTLSNPNGFFTQSGTFTYVVEGIDANQCSGFDTVNITVYPIPTIDAGGDTTFCANDSVELGGSPTGPASASYQWSNSASLDDDTLQNPMAAVVVSTGFYLTVTDTGGCQYVDSVFVFISAPPALDPGPDTSVCIGDSVQLGGSPIATNYDSILWAPSATLSNDTAANPLAGPVVFTTYYVTLIDTFGCSFDDSVDVTVQALPVASAGNDTTICAFANVTIGGNPTGPATGIYNWSPGTLFVDSTLANPQVNVTQDTQLVVFVTDSTTGCSSSDTVQISILALPLADAGADTVIICEGDTVTLGGSPTTTAGNSVSWSPGVDLNDSTLFNPLLTGSQIYFVKVTVTEPVNSCQNFDSVLAIVNAVPVVEAGANDIICLGDTADLGGAPTSSLIGLYQWSGGGFLNFDTIANPTATPTQDTIFFVTVTTSSGCVGTDSIEVDVNPLPVITVTPYVQQCLEDTVQLQVAGGTVYAWDNGDFLSDTSISNPLAFPVGNTLFTVTVTDANSCSDTAQINVVFYPFPNVDAGADDTICNGNAAQLNASGAINYSWTPVAGLTNSAINNPSASPTSTTEYFVEGTDANGCSFIDSLIVYVNVLPAAEAGSDVDVCLNDSIQIGGSPTGPVGASYHWQHTNLDDSLASNPFFLAENISPGVYPYTVSVTDVNGCVSVDQLDINVIDDPIPVINPIANTICIGDTILISAQGGIAYVWSPVGTLTNSSGSQVGALPTDTTEYTVTVTNAFGCSSATSDFVNVFDLTPADAGPDTSVCQQDTFNMDASGGVSYEWGSSLFLAEFTGANPIAYPVQTHTFTVTVTDQNNCSEPDQVTVTVNPLPIAAAGPDERICLNDEIEIGGSPTGPAGSSYQWTPATTLSNGAIANPIATPMITEVYKIVVTSDNGCKDSAEMIVVVDSLPVVKLSSAIDPICDGDTITIYVTPGYETYSWSPDVRIIGLTADSASVYPPKDRTYSVEVTNRNGCISDAQFEVKVNGLPIIEVSEDFEICEDDTVQLEASGGVIYEWSDGLTLADSISRITLAYPKETTKYSITITDTNYCQSVGELTGIVYPLPEIDAGADQENCDIQVIYLGGDPTGPVDAVYYWSPATGLDDRYSPNPALLNPERTTYSLEVQDRNGCFNRDSVTINADCYSLIYAPSAFTPGFNGLNDGFKLEYYRIQNPHLRIYNRWGNLMFETKDLDEAWDGSEPNDTKVAPLGTYYWILTYKDEALKKLSKEGTISLMK